MPIAAVSYKLTNPYSGNWHEQDSRREHGPWTRPCTSKACGGSAALADGPRHVLGFLVEIPAAILVLAEIVVLLAGVISRYVFHSPLIWSDELASILFLWLAMLGAVVAFRRGEHMRMTALVGMLSPPGAGLPRRGGDRRGAGLPAS